MSVTDSAVEGSGAAVVGTGTLGGAVVLRSGLAGCVVTAPLRSAIVQQHYLMDYTTYKLGIKRKQISRPTTVFSLCTCRLPEQGPGYIFTSSMATSDSSLDPLRPSIMI